MTRRQRALLLVLGVAVVLTGAMAVVLRDDDEADVRADAATTSTTVDERATSTTEPDPTTTTGYAPPPPPSTAPGATTSSTSTTSTEPPSTNLAPAPTEPAPPFEASISEVTAADLGSSWRPGCPVAPEALRALDVRHWGYDGAVHQGRVIVAADHAEAVVAALRDVYEARFPIQRMEPVHHFGSDDQASMRANNTSAFNCRTVAGSTSWSEHAYGRAIDINPLHNPYVQGSSVDPPEGARWADRSLDEPGMIKPGDAVVQAFERQGWHWGGYWSSGKDYQHFSQTGR